MNKYEIDYGFGTAQFWTETFEPKDVIREFYTCANDCFGIRKSISKTEIVRTYLNVELPLPYRGHHATHLLTHGGGDTILFDANRPIKGDYMKLLDEHGHWCSCAERGTPELSCEVHHFYVENHDAVCDCMKRLRGGNPDD